MVQKLKKDFVNSKNFIRVRNTPVAKKNPFSYIENKILKIVWHGLTIIPENKRGVHILLQAILFHH